MNIIKKIDLFLNEARKKRLKIKSNKKEVECEVCGAKFIPALGHEKICNSCTAKKLR